jgi:outer membrane protein assembly factor BamB
LAAQVAAHPGLYPDLRDWLAGLGRPDVDAALAATAEVWVATGQTAAAPGQAPVTAGQTPVADGHASAVGDQAPMATSQRPGAPGQESVEAGQTPVVAGQAPKSRLRRRLVLIVAGTVAAALVITAAVIAVLPKGGGDPGLLAPDIAEQPKLGEAIDSRDVLDGDFPRSSFEEPLDSSTGVAVGWGSTGGAMAAFDLRTGEPKWQVDLVEAAGLSEDALAEGFPQVSPDGEGNIVVGAGLRFATVNGAGEVVSTGGLDHRHILACAQGVVVVVGLSVYDEAEGVAAYRSRDLGKRLWGAGTADTGNDTVIHEPSGTFWVTTEDGFVDAATGKEIGLEADAAFYSAPALRTDLAVLRWEEEDRELSRIDPATGTRLWRTGDGPVGPSTPTLWAESVPRSVLIGRTKIATVDQFLVQGHDSRGEPSDITAFSLDSGEQVWRVDSGEMLGANASMVLALADGDPETVVAIRLEGGEKLFEFDLDGWETMDLRAIGAATAYFLNANRSEATVRAVSLDDGAELWEVAMDPPGFSFENAGLEFAGDRMWARLVFQDDQGFETVVPFLELSF